MENFLSGGVEELEQAKAAVLRSEKLYADMLESEKLIKTNDKDIETQKKALTDKIDSAIKERRNSLIKFHDEQISVVKKDLKSKEKDRRNAKAKAVNNRISGETGTMAAENKRLNEQIRTMFRQAKVPAFCNSSLYYSLFHPKTVRDFLVLAAAVILAIAVIPNIVCLLLKTTTFIKVLLYIAIVLIFVAVYFIFFIATKGKGKDSVIEKARPIRKRIRANKNKIRQASDSIRTDTDETGYGLESFDADINQTNAILEERENSKASALEDFDNNIAPQIKQEIESKLLPAIEQLEADGKALKADYTQKQAASSAAITQINNTYATYLGAKNATPERIDELINIINDGQAQTIMQALDIANDGNK